VISCENDQLTSKYQWRDRKPNTDKMFHLPVIRVIGFMTNYDTFLQRVEKDTHTFVPMGEKISEYRLSDDDSTVYEIYKVRISVRREHYFDRDRNLTSYSLSSFRPILARLVSKNITVDFSYLCFYILTVHVILTRMMRNGRLLLCECIVYNKTTLCSNRLLNFRRYKLTSVIFQLSEKVNGRFKYIQYNRLLYDVCILLLREM